MRKAPFGGFIGGDVRIFEEGVIVEGGALGLEDTPLPACWISWRKIDALAKKMNSTKIPDFEYNYHLNHLKSSGGIGRNVGKQRVEVKWDLGPTRKLVDLFMKTKYPNNPVVRSPTMSVYFFPEDVMVLSFAYQGGMGNYSRVFAVEFIRWGKEAKILYCKRNTLFGIHE